MSIDRSEKLIAKQLGGKLTRASGAVCDDADIKIPGFLIECKRRDTLGNKIIFYKKFWEKVRKQSVKANCNPMYIWYTDDKAYCITYLDIYEYMFKDEKTTIVDITYKEKTNISIDLDEYVELCIKTWRTGTTPIIKFSYNCIPFGIVNFYSFRRLNGN